MPWTKAFFNPEFFSYQCAFPQSHSSLVDRLVRSLVPPSPFLFIRWATTTTIVLFSCELNADPDEPYSFEGLPDPLQIATGTGTTLLVLYRCSSIRVRCICVLLLHYLWYSTWINTWFGSIVGGQMNADPHSKDQWFLQCCRSVTFWYGSGSADPYHWHMDPDSKVFCLLPYFHQFS